MRENNLLSRREMLTKGLKTAAAIGLGAVALKGVGNSNPFISSAMENFAQDSLNYTAAEVCTLTCQQTLGPCYFAANLTRRDITEGKAGLPTRLGFHVINTDTCQPIQNASIDIWHTEANGIYSAPISQMCNGNDPNAPNQRFCRGIQLTDANGWAYFDSIYPGWYSGRTTHIHATIRINTTAIVTTQFYFWDGVSEFIYRNHPTYNSRPVRNTTNTTDNILGGSLARMMPYIFSTRVVANRQLQAVKTIAIRTTATTCNA